MISKIAPLMVLGMAAQSYYNKTKKGKKMKEKRELSDKEKELQKKSSMFRSNAAKRELSDKEKELQKKAALLKMNSSRCKSCNGKGCSKCK